MTMQHRPHVVDDRALTRLIEESQDLHLDAMNTGRATMPDLTDIAADRRRSGVSTEPRLATEVEASRQTLIRRLVMSLGGVLGVGAVTSAFANTAAAEDIDVMQLQTAVSLELLAVATYGAALALPFIADGNPVIVTFAKTTMDQHDEHRQAF